MRQAVSRRLVLVLVAVTAAAAALPLGVVPFRDWLDQRERTADLQAQVDDVDAVSREYEDRLDALARKEATWRARQEADRRGNAAKGNA